MQVTRDVLAADSYNASGGIQGSRRRDTSSQRPPVVQSPTTSTEPVFLATL